MPFGLAKALRPFETYTTGPVRRKRLKRHGVGTHRPLMEAVH